VRCRLRGHRPRPRLGADGGVADRGRRGDRRRGAGRAGRPPARAVRRSSGGQRRWGRVRRRRRRLPRTGVRAARSRGGGPAVGRPRRRGVRAHRRDLVVAAPRPPREAHWPTHRPTGRGAPAPRCRRHLVGRPRRGGHHPARHEGAALQRPGVDIPARDVSDAVAGHPGAGLVERGTGEVLDRQAMESYRRRLTEIDEDLDEARTWSDTGCVARLEEERDALLDQLRTATGLAGRHRSRPRRASGHASPSARPSPPRSTGSPPSTRPRDGCCVTRSAPARPAATTPTPAGRRPGS
jgi:hypothetical protein